MFVNAFVSTLWKTVLQSKSLRKEEILDWLNRGLTVHFERSVILLFFFINMIVPTLR